MQGLHPEILQNITGKTISLYTEKRKERYIFDKLQNPSLINTIKKDKIFQI